MYLIVAFSIAVHSAYIGSKVVMSLYALQLGASEAAIGLLAAVYAVAPLVLGIYAGRIADTRGTRAPLIGGAAVIGMGMLVSFFSQSMTALFATALLVGAGFMLFNVSIQTLTGAWGSSERRARHFSILSIGYSISTFIGPVTAGYVIDHYGHARAFLMMALFTLPPIAMLLATRRFDLSSGKEGAQESRSTMELLRLPAVRSVVVVSGLTVGAWDLFAFYLPIYAHTLRFSATTIGMLLGVFAFAAFITRFAMPALLKRWRGERVMFGCLLFAAAAFAAFPASAQLYYIMALTFCVGLGLGCGQPLSMMIAYNRSPAGRAGEVTGLRLTANNVARVVIPVLCGALGAAAGAAPVFWMNALNLAAVSYWISRQ